MISDIVEILFILSHINHALASHHRSGELLMGFLHSAQTDKLVFGIMSDRASWNVEMSQLRMCESS